MVTVAKRRNKKIRKIVTKAPEGQLSQSNKNTAECCEKRITQTGGERNIVLLKRGKGKVGSKWEINGKWEMVDNCNILL